MGRKVVILNGSPRHEGAVSRMLALMADRLEERGCEVLMFQVHDLSFASCCGCMRCRSERRCLLPEDDAHRVAEAVREANALVLGSPCYWGSMSGEMKRLFDRMVYVLMGERPNGMPVALHRGKRAVLVTACNTAWPFSFWFGQASGVFRAFGEILKWSGYRVAGRIARSDARNRGALSERECMKCRKLADKIC